MDLVRLSEQLSTLIDPGPPDDADLIVRVLQMDSESHPGRESGGTVPIVVIGHAAMTEDDWRRWVRWIGSEAYGPGFTERVLINGIDIREMEPTRPFGRRIRVSMTEVWRSTAIQYTFLDAVSSMLRTLDVQPQFYNLVARMAGEDMTLREFADRLFRLPLPTESPGNDGRSYTLGDFIDGPFGRKGILPSY
jgi:hypothetical protein